jgi:hypothetical protein
MRAAIFASRISAPDTDEERERLEDLIATIVDWDQVKDGNSDPPIRLNPPDPCQGVRITQIYVLRPPPHDPVSPPKQPAPPPAPPAARALPHSARRRRLP